MNRSQLGVIAVVALIVGPALLARSGGHHCQRCGCDCCCLKACKVTCEPQKKTVYDCKCEDFCVPGPSKRCGTICETTCDGHCAKYPNYIPNCGSVRTKRVLVKHEVETCKPNYKWVVEYLCPQCSQECGGHCGEACAQGVTVEDPNAEEIAATAPAKANAGRVAKASVFAPMFQAFSR